MKAVVPWKWKIAKHEMHSGFDKDLERQLADIYLIPSLGDERAGLS